MKEQFDKVLRDHIKDTFDEYDDGLAHDGWLHYQRKLRNRKRKTVLLWTLPSGIAASLLFLLFFKPENISDNNKNDSHIIVQTQTEKGTVIASIPGNKKTEPVSPIRSKNVKRNSVSSSIENKGILEDNNRQYATSSVSVPATQMEQHIAELPPARVNELIVKEQSRDENTIITEPVTTEIPKSLFGENETPVYAEVSSPPTSSFAYENTKKDKIPLKNRLRNLKLSVDASTYMNFSDAGMNDDVNVAIGLVSEYQITRNLSVNSGINVNRQSSSFTQEVPAPQDNIQNAMALTNSIASVVNGQFTNAKLVGFDIPLNIKYSTANKKVNWFVSSGISSYALINEKYFNNFSVTSFAFSGVETSTVSTIEEHSENPISSFQLARSLNFSFGVSFPMKKVTTLSIEPFIKYPLRQFGQQNLTLGASGVSIKMHLNKKLFKN